MHGVCSLHAVHASACRIPFRVPSNRSVAGRRSPLDAAIAVRLFCGATPGSGSPGEIASQVLTCTRGLGDWDHRVSVVGDP